MKLKQLKVKSINEAIEDTAIAKDYVGTMGFVMADAINTSKKKREDVKKIMEERGKDLPNQDRYAHMKDKGTPEMKKMHLSEDAFQIVDLRNRGNKSRKALKESVDENKLAKFIDNSIKGLQNGDATNYRFKLDDRLAVFVGWSDGYDENDDDIIHDKEYPTFGINVGVKVWTSDDMWTDYDFLNFAYYEDSGDVIDSAVSVSPNYNADNLADSMIAYYNDLKDLTIEEDGKIINSVEESLDVSQTHPIDTTKSIAGRKSMKESTSKIMSTEEFLDWHDNKVNPREDMGKLTQIYHIFELNGCSEDGDVDYCYDECDDKQKREIMDIIMTESLEESFLNETDDVDSRKCADILNNWIDWEEADYDSDNALDQLRSLQTEKAITEKEYDFIVKNWDDLLAENFADDDKDKNANDDKEELTEGVKFGQSSYEDLVSTVCEYYVDHSGKDALESILGLMKDLDEDNAYKLLYAVAEKVEEFVGEELEDSQKYPIESPFDKKEGKGGLKADQKYPIKPSGEKKDSQFVKAEQKAPVGLTESVKTIGFDKVLPIIKDWCGSILGEEDCENLAQEFSIGMSNGENCFDILNRVASQYGLDVDEFEGICGDIESNLVESTSRKTVDNKLEEDLKVYLDDLSSFEPWSGAVETWEKIVDAKKLDTLNFMLEDMYPDGISEVELNDLLRFDSEWVLDMVGISDDVSDEEEDTDDQDDVTDTDDEIEESTKNTSDEEVPERSEYDVDVSQEEADAIAESLLNMMNAQDNN